MNTESQLTKLPVPQTYFGLIEKVGSDGKYQFHIFILFLLNFYVSAMLLLGTSFLFMNRQFDCAAHGIQTNNCEETICAMDRSEWHKYLGQQLINSLATQFGPYYCEDQTVLFTYRTILYVGTFVGYVVFLFFADNFGRKFSAVLTWAVTFAGIFLLSIAQNMAMACVGLFFAGAGCESAIRISVAIFAEIVEYNRRQTYSIALGMGFGVSAILVGLLYWIFRDWRTIIIVFCCVPCFILLIILVFYLEETPKFLLTKATPEKAEKALNKIGRVNKGLTNLITREDIERVYQNEQVGGNKFQFIITPVHLFTYKSLRTKTICTSLLFIFIYFLYMGPLIIIDDLGLNPFLSQVVISISEIISYPICFFFITRTPRIKSGYIFFGLSAIFTGILVFVTPPDYCNGCIEGFIEIILVFCSRFCICYYFSIFFLYVTEIFPLRARGLGFGIASAFGAVASASAQFIFSEMEERGINSMIFLTIAAILPMIVLTFLDETHNKPLQTQIKEIKEEKQGIKKEDIDLQSPKVMEQNND